MNSSLKAVVKTGDLSEALNRLAKAVEEYRLSAEAVANIEIEIKFEEPTHETT